MTVWLKTPAAAKALGLNERTLRRSAKAGTVRGIRVKRIGAHYLWCEEDIAGRVSGNMQREAR
jgi:hypothetical protein